MYKWSVINATKRLRISTFVKSKGSHDIGNNKFRHWIVVDAFISPLHYNWWRMRTCGAREKWRKVIVQWYDVCIYIQRWMAMSRTNKKRFRAWRVLEMYLPINSLSFDFCTWVNKQPVVVGFMRTHTGVGCFFHMDFVCIWTSPSKFSFSRHACHSPDTTMVCVCVCRHISIPVLSNWNSYFYAWRWLFLLFLTLGIKSQCNGKIDFQIGKEALGGERIFIHSRWWWCNRKQCEQQQKKYSMCCYTWFVQP